MYKVTIQATTIVKTDWKVVASGRWTPGQPPELDNSLAPEVLGDLFNFTPATDQSGRNQIQCGDTRYAVVFRRFSRNDHRST